MKRVAFVLLLCLWAVTAHAAVAFDCAFQKGGSSVSSISFASNAGTVACTPAANANRVLIAFLGIYRNAGTATTNAAVTWGGTSMTLIGSKLISGPFVEVWTFGLINPASGSQTLAATWTGGVESGADLGAMMFYNADQTTGYSDATTATGTSTGPTVTVTNVGANDASAVMRVDDNASTATVTAGTLAYDERSFDGNFGETYRLGSGTNTWSMGTSVSWAMAGIRIIDAGGGGGGGCAATAPRMALLRFGGCKG